MAVPIIFFLSSAIIIITFVYLYFSTRHKERMALIEHGRDAGIFKERKYKSVGSTSLKFGLFLVFIGVGFLIGHILINTFDFDEGILVSTILMSGGLALLLY